MDQRSNFPKSIAEELIREKTQLRGPFRWEQLHGDGSERVFYRVTDRKVSLVLVWSPLEDEVFPNENDSYVYMGNHLLEKGIPVPEIYGYSRAEGLTLLEDLGSVHLQDLVLSADERLIGLYGQAIELLLRIQTEASGGLDTSYCFDGAVYDQPFIIRRELDYFRWSFLAGALELEIDADHLDGDFSLLASRAGDLGGRSFFLHRDFQSRNLMVRGDLLYLIDFQGARIGPPQYDLASLLLDPYVQLSEFFQKELLASHSKNLSELTGVSIDEFMDRFPHVALCRSLQVLGAFAFLTKIKGRSHFAQYIMPAWIRLKRLLTEASCSDYHILAKLVENQSDEVVAKAAARLEREARSAERQAPSA